MLLATVVAASEAVGATRSRREKVTILADTVAATSTAEVASVVSWLSGVVPQRRLGVGWRALSTMPDPAPAPSLGVADVRSAFNRLAGAGGRGAASARRHVLFGLLSRATEPEQRFLRGLVTGTLRQGALDGVMIPAIARAYGVPENLVRRATMLAGFAGPVAEAAAEAGAIALEAVDLVVGRPVRPMLAASAAGVVDAVGTLADVVVDGKIDGIRIQVHRFQGEVRVFTRTLDDITARVPEVVEAMSALPGGDLVLDGEAVVVGADGRPAPFQVTGARTASRADIGRLRATAPLTTYLFDVLHNGGRSLLDEPLTVRCDVLAELAPSLLVPRRVASGPEDATRFFDELVAAGHEGVVVKDPNGTYAAGRRGSQWVKVKPRHTLDLVVLAVERGSGRRRGFLSNIHLGARNPDTGGFTMLGKTFKGMTDEMLRWQSERFAELAVEDDGSVVTLRPEQVVEVAVDGIQRSSRYPGGMTLRFARVVRYRDDKTADEADTVETVRAVSGG